MSRVFDQLQMEHGVLQGIRLPDILANNIEHMIRFKIIPTVERGLLMPGSIAADGGDVVAAVDVAVSSVDLMADNESSLEVTAVEGGVKFAGPDPHAGVGDDVSDEQADGDDHVAHIGLDPLDGCESNSGNQC